MFLRYLGNNMRHKKLFYLILVFCEVLMLVISIIANAIMNDNIAKQNGLKEGARSYWLPIRNNTELSEIKDKFYTFVDSSPMTIEYIMIDVLAYSTEGWVNSLDGSYNYDPDSLLIYFPSYSGLKDYYLGLELSVDDIPTEQQLDSNEKFAMIGKGAGYNEYGDITYTDADHALLGSEEVYVLSENTLLRRTQFFLGHEPEGLELHRPRVGILLKDYPTEQQAEEVYQVFANIFSGYVDDDPGRAHYYPKVQDLLDTRKTVSSIVMTLFVQIISAFNVLLLFKFMIDSRKKQFAVLRLCGFEKSVCLKYSFGELMMISGVSAIISCVAVTLLKPELSKYYSIFKVMFGAGHLALLSIGFLAAAALVFAIYIIPSLRKTVSRELREM